ncbi:hypothetical protein OIU76_003020 [Salix suchowensis]|nr:hypothetical protein OIU76_003020 [Salix suchowensis]
MHNVLLKLGRKIIVQENIDPRKRSRLWDATDVYRVLTTQGTGKVESISLNLSATKEINLSPAAFEGMYNLRLLKFYYPYYSSYKRVIIHLPQGLPFLSNELRILYWCDYPLTSLPSNFFPEKLVVLEMPRSQLEHLWNDYQPLENLKLMNLCYSSKLILSDFDFSNLPNLEVLNLKQCSEQHTNNLCTLPPSIGFLSQLVKLDLSSNRSLTCLPDNIGELKSLVELNLASCFKLASLPSSIGELKCLVKLILDGCSLASLPESIGELKSLVKLYISCCSKLSSLPDSIGELKCLAELRLNGSSELASLPKSIGELKSLVRLYISNCSGLSSLPDNIGELKCLAELRLNGSSELASLPKSIGELKSLVRLYISNCSGLSSLPDNIGELKCLAELRLNGSSELASLPKSIGELKSLVRLYISNCSGLSSLPDSIGELKCLAELRLVRCSGLSSLPDSIGELKCLAELNLNGCSQLASLPNSIYGLESLKLFNLALCNNLNGFSSLNRRRSEVEEIASTTNKLGCLQSLNLRLCGVLETPGSIGSWVSLKVLIFSGNYFERIPVNIKLLPMLIELYLNGCERLQHLPQLPSSLRVLIASDCISLASVAGIYMQGEKDYEAASQQFNFYDCLRLDQNSLTKIIGDAHLRILHMTTSLFNQQYFGEPIRVRLCIPGLEVPEWVTYKNTGPAVKIKLPAHWHPANTTDQLFGFTLCAVVSFDLGQKYRDFDIKCECHLITKDGSQNDLSFYYYEDDTRKFRSWKREHVFIWSIHSHRFFKEASFHFKLLGANTADAVIQSGVHPLYVQNYIDKPEQTTP